MRKLILIGSLLLVSGCAWFRDPPEQQAATGATLVYQGGRHGGDVFSVCDKGNLVYLTQKNPNVAVVPQGCSGPGPVSLSPATIAALTERQPERIIERVPVVTPQAAPPPHVPIPQPLLVQLVPTSPPIETRAAAPEPVIVQIQPQAQPTLVCPACPLAPPVLQPQVQVLPRSVGPPKPAAKALTVAQVDPNTASLVDLERLPGVTRQAAEAITKGRPYRTLQDLVSKKALTEAELKALAPYFVIQ